MKEEETQDEINHVLRQETPEQATEVSENMPDALG